MEKAFRIEWPSSKITAASSTRHGGLEHAVQLLNLAPLPVVRMDQTHSNHIAWVETIPSETDVIIPDTDAVLTSLTQTVLAVKTADCLPILVSHTEGLIGAIHAGRRSLDQQIVARVVQQVLDRGFSPHGFTWWFGPAICEACYQIDPVQDKHYNLAAEAKQQLCLTLGLTEFELLNSNQCTACRNNHFYSYRKEGAAAGRQQAVIMRW